MMKKLALVAGLAFVAHSGLALAGEAKTETKTAETKTAEPSADGAKTTKKAKKSKKGAEGEKTTETKTETK